MNEQTYVDKRRKRTISFIRDTLKLIEKYKDIDPESVNDILKSLEIGKPKKRRGAPIEPSKEDVERFYSIDSRSDLIKYLNDKEKFPTVPHLAGLARALHIKNTSKLSEEQLKQSIICIFDKAVELRNMAGHQTDQKDQH